MATPRDSAKKILAIFAELDVGPNEILIEGRVSSRFVTNEDGTAEDYSAGLQYALEHGWVERDGQKLRLTQGGFDEI